MESIIRLYARWIREGKLPVNSDWNKDLGVTFTVQDPCQLVRKSLGDPVAEDLRFVVRSVVGEENFIDMWPNKSNNYCCGGGGGFNGIGRYREQRNVALRKKMDQILDTGCKLVVAPCHNCWDAIRDLEEEFEIGIKWSFLKPLIIKMLDIPDHLKPPEEEGDE